MSVITLLTDFGTRDYFVGAMKGVILSINPEALIVDITHEIEPQQISSASFTLASCYKNFPSRTIHLAVVDPGVGSDRRAILVETREHYFIAPDNGLLDFVFEETSNFRVFELTEKKYFLPEVGCTFHGRDVFAPVAAHLSRGVAPGDFGREIDDFVRLTNIAPRKISETEISGEILHIDRFGNLITNFKNENLPAKFCVEVKGKSVARHQKYYAEAAAGEVFSIEGSAGFLEIAAFYSSAAKILRASVGQRIKLRILAE
jgi:Uncharacterized conserved protein